MCLEPKAKFLCEFIVIIQCRKVAALVNDAKNHRGIAGGGDPRKENHMLLVVDRAQACCEQTPVAPTLGVSRDAFEGTNKPPVVLEPLIVTPGLNGVAANLVQVLRARRDSLMVMLLDYPSASGS